MSDEAVNCPDCGGYIGLSPDDDRQPCTCFANAPKTQAPATTLRPAIARMMAQAENAARRNATILGNTDDSAAAPAARPATLPVEQGNGQTARSNADAPAAASEGTDSAASSEKRCRVCDKDLTGHRRIKDSLGYICRDCVKAEAPPEDPTRRPCPECNRLIKPGGFVPYNGKHICRRCFADHMELHKYKKAAPSAAAFVQEEKKSVTRLLIFASILLILMVWSAYKHLGQH